MNDENITDLKLNNDSKMSNRKKSVTAGIVLSVFAVIVCVFIILGGVNTSGDISDIFISERYNTEEKKEGTLPVSYDSEKLSYKLEYNRQDKIVLTYKNGEIYYFDYNDNNRLISVSDKNGNKLIGYIYKDENIVGEMFYDNGVINEYNEYTVTYDKNYNKKTAVKYCDGDGNVKYSRIFVTDENDNVIEYYYVNENDETVTQYKKNYIYDEFGRLSNVNMSVPDSDDIRSVYKYDEKGNIIYSGIMNNDLTTAVTTYSYNYDEKGNIISFSENINFSLSGKTETVITENEYNNENRIISTRKKDVDNNVLYSESTVYDSSGNISKAEKKDFENKSSVLIGYRYYDYQRYSIMKNIIDYWDFEKKEFKDFNGMLYF